MSDLPTSLTELEAAAKERLPRPTYDYYAGGAEDELTLAANREAYDSIFFRPRVLVDVSNVDTSVELLGHRYDTPVFLAPTAFQKLSDPEGELATVRAAGRANTLKVLSSLSSYTVEEILAEATAPLWQQLYVFKDRGLSEEFVRRAEAAGCQGLCLTVTVPVQGNRERDRRNNFDLPEGVDMANFRGLIQERFPEGRGGSALKAYINAQFDPSLTWEALEWLASVTDLPLIVKGVTTRDDARLAADHGAAVVIVSNHGGRQLDGAEPTIRALPHVVAGAAGRIPVLVDGGVRRGRDVVKALCLGAAGVLIGRPYLWGLAVGGEQGVTHVLDTLDAEVRRTLALIGCPDISRLGPEYLDV